MFLLKLHTPLRRRESGPPVDKLLTLHNCLAAPIRRQQSQQMGWAPHLYARAQSYPWLYLGIGQLIRR